jgi:hypothetical protein
MKIGLLIFLAAFGAASVRADVMTFGAIHDTSIVEEDPSNSNGGGPGLFVGTDGDNSPHRALISFNVSGIPAGATVTNVQLTLTLGQVAGAGGGGGTGAVTTATIGIFDLTRSWGEGTVESDAVGLGGTGHGKMANPGDATWSSAFFQQATWSTQGGGGDHVSTASASLFLNNNADNTPFTWASTPQLVADVQGWVNNPSTNFGWELINADETDPRTFFCFYSREWATFLGGIASQEPALVVTYTPPVGVPVPAWASAVTLVALVIVCSRSLGRQT